MNDMHNYSINKQRAIAEMFDMNRRATKSQNLPNNHTLAPARIFLDPDTLVILALMYILYSDNADMLLVFALAYILI